MLRRFLLSALNTALPVTCAACDQAIGADQTPALCPDCFAKVQMHSGPQCHRCATRVDALFIRPDLTCGSCLRDPPAFYAARAGLVYAETGRSLILGLKHGGRRANAKLLARYMVSALPQVPASTLLPIPLHESRLRTRGFNQALVLAEEVGRLLGYPVQRHTLRRTRATPSQGEQTAKGRHRNVAGAFRLHDPQPIKDKHLILIDDVITSGATVRAAARVLEKAGAASILVLAAARALPK